MAEDRKIHWHLGKQRAKTPLLLPDKTACAVPYYGLYILSIHFVKLLPLLT